MDTLTQTVSHIEGVTLTELRQISDARGTVLHMLRNDAPDFIRFGECYFSEVLPGAIKAWRRHRVQTQNLAVPVGQARIAIYDDRVSSPTRGVALALDLGRPAAYLRLRIPSGLWYGFACVGETPALLVNCADYPHDPYESDVLPIHHQTIPYHWPKR